MTDEKKVEFTPEEKAAIAILMAKIETIERISIDSAQRLAAQSNELKMEVSAILDGKVRKHNVYDLFAESLADLLRGWIL